MPKKKTDEVIVVEPVIVQNPPVSAVAETPSLENGGQKNEPIKTEIKPKDNNVVSFVKSSYAPTGLQKDMPVQQPQIQRPQYQPQQAPRPQVHYAPPAPVQTETIEGALEIMQDGQGFVRPKFIPNNRDAFIGSMQIRRYGLRAGDMILGAAKAPKENEKYWAMTRIDKVNGLDLAQVQNRPEFKDLVPIYPQKQIKLETASDVYSTRIIDLFSPIGFGQRGMVVSPPKAGKTTLLKEIAAGVAINYPEVHLMAILVGERPEEVTDMQRFIKGEVIASSFDQKPEEQTKAAEIAMERAKRLVEMGKDVVVVFDSITRLARAYNLAIPTSGRTLSGGFDPAALYPSKKFFGAARKIENGGSLTIIGTSLVDTGSKMDELIFEEFKGTGNMELRLERNLAERRIFPAFDILRSGTRMENLLLDPAVMAKIISIRRMFDALGKAEETTEMILGQMAKTKNNQEFLDKIGKK
ncbi:MAG: transcription termination factor Rho [Candidatus Shapirobacteria bacterium]|nr:transcription termination factor Rho [Candidatus Shapirobacteria bacterium]